MKSNWYKMAQEETTFPFMDDPSVMVDAPERYTFEEEVKDQDSLNEVIDQATDRQSLESLLREQGYDYEAVDFPTNKVVLVVSVEGSKYVIDDPDNPFSSSEADDWVNMLSEMDLYELYGDQEADFWEFPMTLYHGTYAKSIEDIRRNGLEPRDETRGMENKWTGSGVFMSDNYDEPFSHGYDFIIEVDTAAMKADGYMPPMGREEPVQEADLRNAAANAVGIENYHCVWEQGIMESTTICRDVIPPKYLKVLD